jgi:hypothetical protein
MYSEMIAVNVANTYGLDENETGLGIAVYPNPNSGNFRIELSAEKTTRARLRIFTAAGEPAWGPFDTEISHKLSLPVHVESMAEGMYLLQVETSTGIANYKIMIKK